jgi:prepilin peptidase CpaA
MTMHDLLVCVPLLALLIWAAATDLHSRRIPNWLSFTMILSGFGVNAAGLGLTSGWYALFGFLLGFAMPFVLFVIGALRGGDVKLLAGIGAWLGPAGVIKVFLLEAVIGAVIVIAQAVAQGRLRVLMRNSTVLAISMAHARDLGMEHVKATGQSSRSVDRPLPFAVPVLMAMLILLARSWR